MARTNDKMRRAVYKRVEEMGATLLKFYYCDDNEAECIILEGGYEPARIRFVMNNDELKAYYK